MSKTIVVKRTPSWYFSGAISAMDQTFIPYYRTIVGVLKALGNVPTEHVTFSNARAWEEGESAKGVNVHERDFCWLDQSTALVADISVATTGGGAEIDYAVRAGLPTLLVCHEEKRGTWYLSQWVKTVNPPPNLEYVRYASSAQLENIVRTFAEKVVQNTPLLPGAYIVLEGGEGCGKTKQRELVAVYLREQGYAVEETREPGGTQAGEVIRNLLQNPDQEKLCSRAELFLFEAARAQLFEKKIIPALKNGVIVCTDRSYYSTIAYQGFGRQLGLQTLDLFNGVATYRTKPDLGIVIDVDPKEGLKKTTKTEFGKADRFEQEQLDFHERVRQGYLAVARREPNTVVVPYIHGIEAMHAVVREKVDAFLSRG